MRVEKPVDNVQNPSYSNEYFLWEIFSGELCNIQLTE